MPRFALDSIEELPDGRWVCMSDTTISGPRCAVKIQKGQTFRPHTAFAGFNDFTVYLASVSAEAPAKSPHEWP
jgi:hypothetical protein